VIPFVERMDYLSYYFNAMAFCMAVESLLDEEVPERAQWLRVIHLELNRVASHLFWIATGALDLGAITMLWWGCRDRDLVLDLFEMSAGSGCTRATSRSAASSRTSRPAGGEGARVHQAMPTALDQYEDLLDRNEIWLQRLKGTGVLSRGALLELGVTGPLLRAPATRGTCARPCRTRATSTSTSTCRSGTSATTTTATACGSRRCASRSDRRAGARRPARGPYITPNRKVALPPRHELATSMEALIHHFKLVTEGFRVPPGETYAAIESPRGELGCYVLADGSAKPARVHMRDPSFVNLQALPEMARDQPARRLHHLRAMLDPILGGWTASRGRPHAGGARRGGDPRHRRSRPVGTRASTSRPIPATIPRPRVGRRAGRAARRDRAPDPPLSDRHSATLPALGAAQRCTAGARRGDPQVAAVMQVTPAYLSSVATFYDMLRTERPRAPTCTCARASPATCATRSASTTRSQARPTAQGSDERRAARVRVPRRVRHGADGVRSTVATWARFGDDAAEAIGQLKAGETSPGRGLEDPGYAVPTAAPQPDGRARAPEVRAGRRRVARDRRRGPAARRGPGPAPAGPARAAGSRDQLCARAGGGRGVNETRVLLANIDEPDLNTMAVYERLGGYKAMRKALLEMDPAAVLSQLEESGLRGRGGAGFSMGKKASFIPKGEMDKYLCCNADESEPGTFKDRLLMQKNPHMLIEGCIIGSIAAGANKGFIFIRGEYELQADILDAAVAEAYEKGYLGERILDSDHSFDLVVHRGKGAYICGEETGLLDALEGKRGNPRLKPPFPANQGLYQGPTLINNVETLCNARLIIENGADWFKQWARATRPAPRSSRCRATCSGRATTRSRSGSRCATSSTGSRAGRPRDAT
jgi:NADH:ubiquinone oxidoreductase subunit D